MSDAGLRTTITDGPVVPSWQGSALGARRPAPPTTWLGGPPVAGAPAPSPANPPGPSAEELVEAERREALQRAAAQGLAPSTPDPAGVISRSEAGRTWEGAPLAAPPRDPAPRDFFRDGPGAGAPTRWRERRAGAFTAAPDVDHAALVEEERAKARARELERAARHARAGAPVTPAAPTTRPTGYGGEEWTLGGDLEVDPRDIPVS